LIKPPIQKVILVLGANAGQADLIRHMKLNNWYVVCCSHRNGEVGELLADEFYCIDIKDVKSVVTLAQSIKADLVYSVSSDIAITSSVSASEVLKTNHFFNSDLVDLFNNKSRMRNFLNSHNLGYVKYSTIKSDVEVEDWDLFPCIVKPVDSQGQRGVQLINSKDNLCHAVKIALKLSEKRNAIVEEFLDGIEISCNVLMQNGICLFDVLSERLVHGGELTGIPRGHLVPCVNVSLKNINNSLELVRKIVEALGIKNGCLYFQMKVTSKGIRVIEIAPRLDGCHMWRLIKHATGHNYLANTINTLIDKSSNIESRPAVKLGDFYELIFQQAPLNSSFYKSEHPTPVDSLYHEYRYLDGDRINPVNGKLEIVGYYVRKLLPKDLKAHKINDE